MNDKHQKTIDGYANGLTTLSDFLQKYNPNKDWGFHINVGASNVKQLVGGQLYIWKDDDLRDHKLTEAAKVFGATGWTATPDSDGVSFNWTKIIDDVYLCIIGAEYLPPLTEHSVAPSAFPLQLESASV